MRMKKLFCRIVATVMVATLVVGYGSILDTTAATLESDTEETSIAAEDVSVEDGEAAEEEAATVTEEYTEEDTSADIEDEITSEDVVSEEETIAEATTEYKEEVTEAESKEETLSASLMASSDYTYSVISSSAKTIKITGYTGSATSITIPSTINGYTVTAIGEWAFQLCDNLTSVSIPDSVTSIGEYAFCDCFNLKNVKIPNGVKSIGDYAFLSCSSITSITIPSSVTSIGMRAFLSDSSLTKITVDSNNTKYSSKNGILYNKNKTKLICCPSGKTDSFTIPSSVTSIGDFAFCECKSLKTIEIPDSVKSIGGYAFSYCSNLKHIGMPSSVTSIGTYAFENCSSLTEIFYAGTKAKWKKISFKPDWKYGCPSNLTIYYNIKSVKIKTSSFTYSGSANKPGVVIKNGSGNTLSSKYYTVTYKNNKNVGTATVTIKLKNGYSGTIKRTFKINPKGTSVSSISKGSTYLTVKWNKQSAKMSTSRISGYQIQYSTSSSFSSGNKTITVSGYSNTSKKITGLKSGTKYYVRIRTYKTINGTKYYSGWSSVKSAKTNTNYYKYSVLNKSKKTIKITGYTGSATSITIPSKIDGYKVTAIGDGAFEGSNITSVTIPDGVTSIGNFAFAGCEKLTSISIPGSVTSIGEYAFYYCIKLGSVTLPNITCIKQFTFADCLGLTSVTIPSSVKTIEGDAFESCWKLTSVTIPSSVTTIEIGAFNDCESLTNITVNSKNKNYSSKDGILYNKKKTKLIFCPCGKKDSISIPSSVTSIGDRAFEFCNITSLEIPSGVTSIGSSAFYGCNKLTNVYIPNSVVTISAGAFCDCNNLSDIFYAGTETSWNKISIGDDWNAYCAANLEIHYGIKSVTLSSTSYTYSGSEKKPGITIKDSNGNTISSQYYSVTYKNNINVGTATVTISFKNGYSGTMTKIFRIVPKGTSISSITKGSKSFTVKWKKQSAQMSTSRITGYEIQYSTSSDFSSTTTKTVSGYSNTSKKITGLKSNKKYYVRIRTYKSINGTKYYSSWSSVKTVTTK